MGFVVVIAIVALAFTGVLGGKQSTISFPTTTNNNNQPVATASKCPTDGDTSFTLNVYNDLNTSGAENYDMTVVCKSNSGHVVTITDTTDPTPVTLNCGETYTCKGVSADGAGGDNSKFTSVRVGKNFVTLNSDGSFTFTPDASNVQIDMGATQHGVLEARVYDNDNAGYVYASGDSSAGTYKTTGATFESTTDNSTALAVGTGGTLDLRMDVRVNSANDEQFADKGFYLLIDAQTNGKWDTPSVKINGKTYTSDCSALNSHEQTAYTDYNWCYKITDLPITLNDKAVVDLGLAALSGVDPGASDDLTIAFASIGQYESTTDQTNVLTGAVTDAPSPAQVFALQSYTLDIA